MELNTHTHTEPWFREDTHIKTCELVPFFFFFKPYPNSIFLSSFCHSSLSLKVSPSMSMNEPLGSSFASPIVFVCVCVCECVFAKKKKWRWKKKNKNKSKTEDSDAHTHTHAHTQTHIHYKTKSCLLFKSPTLYLSLRVYPNTFHTILIIKTAHVCFLLCVCVMMYSKASRVCVCVCVCVCVSCFFFFFLPGS